MDLRRVGFVGFAAKELHLTRHAVLSLGLDTSPLYASHTTAADTLRQGVPLLPLPGKHSRSRVSTRVSTPSTPVDHMQVVGCNRVWQRLLPVCFVR